MTKSALVIGAGIAGIQASLDLAGRDIHVYLVDKDPTTGGKMCRLDKTFPTNDCSACILSPKMADVAGHPNITTLTYTEVMKVDGKAGDFKVTVKKKPRYVDLTKCTGCGDCIAKCPTKNIPDEFEYGLSTRKAIYIPHAQAVPRVALIDPNYCKKILAGKCGVCEKTCLKGAINYEDKEEIEVLDVGSIVVATGFQVWDANIATEYGYGRYDNVVTSMEFERMMCASGPDHGHIKRRSEDHEEPKKIAFVQCCGSRSEKKGWKKYCSSVCCMYATKQAMITKEHADVQEDIFFMDIRSYGKEFEAYIHRGEDQYGINMHRSSRVSNVEENADKTLTVNYTDANGDPKSDVFDLVVLSVGLNPPAGAEEFSKILGINLNEYGFCETSVFHPLETSREGIYVSGAFAAPKDIPTTVAESSGAAAKAGACIVDANFEPCAPKEFPAETSQERSPGSEFGFANAVSTSVRPSTSPRLQTTQQHSPESSTPQRQCTHVHRTHSRQSPRQSRRRTSTGSSSHHAHPGHTSPSSGTLAAKVDSTSTSSTWPTSVTSVHGSTCTSLRRPH